MTAPVPDEVLRRIAADPGVEFTSGQLFSGNDEPTGCSMADLARALLAAREALRGLLRAIERGADVGCIDHTDCWDTAEAEWWEPQRKARSLLPETPSAGR